MEKDCLRDNTSPGTYPTQIANLVKNHHLAKSISDAAWGRFLDWVRYYGVIQQVAVVAVAPHWTSQRCSGCRYPVKKSLSERTHRCVHCGLMLDRDANAARVRRFGAYQISPTGR